LRSQQPAVSGDDDAIAANQDGIDETELGDRGGDLSDLFSRMGPRVSDVWD
jgi:hypothetical protein